MQGASHNPFLDLTQNLSFERVICEESQILSKMVKNQICDYSEGHICALQIGSIRFSRGLPTSLSTHRTKNLRFVIVVFQKKKKNSFK